MSVTTITASAGSNGILNDFASSWANARAGTSGNINISPYYQASNTGFGSAPYSLSRQFAFFSLSSLKSGARITAATIIMPIANGISNDWKGTWYLVSHTNTDPISASTANFIKIGSETTYGSIANSSISGSTTNSITLTSDGIAALLTPNIGGTAKIALRHSDDINNTPHAAYGDQWNLSTQAWQLQITYSLPGGSFIFNLV